jgi:hypothetical protein
MVRALTTLLGLAAAAAILYLVSDVGDSGGSLWPIAGVWAGAGLALGILYQAGGRRSPGLRMNVPMLIFAFLPWTLLSAALVAVEANNPVWLADRGRDVLPDSWIARWEVSLPAFALVAGVMLAFSLVEPRIGMRPPEPEPVEPASSNPYVPESPWQAPEERPTVIAAPPVVEQPPLHEVAPDPAPVGEQTAIEERPTVLRLTESTTPENPVQVIHPSGEDTSDE